MKIKKFKLNNDVISLVVFLMLNGLLGYVSIDLLCELFNWSIPLWLHIGFGYVFGFIIAPITIVIFVVKILMGI